MKLGNVLAATLAALGIAGIAVVQPALAARLHDLKLRDDVYLLPPPSELRTMTLGYHAAAVDGLWAILLVEYGTHWQEKRAFTQAPRYLDGILALEPDFSLAYKYGDTLIIYRPPRGTEEDWYTAKDLLERGTRERPHDGALWLHYGQFLAFTSLTFVTKKDELDRFRREGAEAMVRAVELGADTDRSITAATLLTKYGKKDAAIKQLVNAYALTDDPAEREELARKFAVLEASDEKDAAEKRDHLIEDGWTKSYGFLNKYMYMLVEPMPDPMRCAGWNPGRRCPRTWDDVLGEAGLRDDSVTRAGQ